MQLTSIIPLLLILLSGARLQAMEPAAKRQHAEAAPQAQAVEVKRAIESKEAAAQGAAQTITKFRSAPTQKGLFEKLSVPLIRKINSYFSPWEYGETLTVTPKLYKQPWLNDNNDRDALLNEVVYLSPTTIVHSFEYVMEQQNCSDIHVWRIQDNIPCYGYKLEVPPFYYACSLKRISDTIFACYAMNLNRIDFWDTEQKKLIAQFKLEEDVLFHYILPLGQHFLVRTDSELIMLSMAQASFAQETARLELSIDHNKEVACTLNSGDFAIAGKDYVAIYGMDFKSKVYTQEENNAGAIGQITDKLLVTCSGNGSLKIWDIATLQCVQKISLEPCSVTRIAKLSEKTFLVGNHTDIDYIITLSKDESGKNIYKIAVKQEYRQEDIQQSAIPKISDAHYVGFGSGWSISIDNFHKDTVHNCVLPYYHGTKKIEDAEAIFYPATLLSNHALLATDSDSNFHLYTIDNESLLTLNSMLPRERILLFTLIKRLHTHSNKPQDDAYVRLNLKMLLKMPKIIQANLQKYFKIDEKEIEEHIRAEALKCVEDPFAKGMLNRTLHSIFEA